MTPDFSPVAGSQPHFKSQDEGHHAGLQILHFEHLDVEAAEPRASQRRPERRLLGGILRLSLRSLCLSWRRCRVEGRKGRSVAGNHGRLPADPVAH